MREPIPLHWNKEVALADLASTFSPVADILAKPVGLPPHDAIHAEVIHRDGGTSFYKEVMDLPLSLGDELPLVLHHLSQRWLGTLAATPRGHALLIKFRAGHRESYGYQSIADGPTLEGDAAIQRVMELLSRMDLSPFERTSLLRGWVHQVQ